MKTNDKKVLKLLKRIDNGYRPTEEETSFLEAQTEWDLSDAPITVLPESIGQLSNLQKLYLSSTQITELPKSIGQLSKLQLLDLRNTQITELSESIGQLTNLYILSLRDSRVTNLPESIGQLTHLPLLDLHGTEITTLPESIGQLTFLQQLFLTNTPITALPESIGQLSNLQELNLSNTFVTSLPKSIGLLSNLKSLYLGGTPITKLPESIGKLSHLYGLDLSDTHITELPESIGQLSNLQSLYLSNTKITSLPESIGKLSHLYGLDLSDTHITELPESIGQLSYLEALHLSNTPITALPESIGQLSYLHKLYLSGTPITILPEFIGQLSILQTLDLRVTQITELPESFGLLSSLQELDFSNTPITALPESIGLLSHLQTLDLSRTPITALPESFGQLSNLQALDLGSTQIAELPESIGLLSNLQNLYLWDTQITKLSESFRQLSNLQVLDLENTRITSLPEWLGELPNLRQLDLSGLTLPGIPASLALRKLPFVETNRFWEPDSGINLQNTILTEQDKSIFLHAPELIPSLYIREEEVPLRECRVLFLGDGGAGKTYTIRRLQNDCRKETADAPYVTTETPGVEIEDYHTQRDGEDVCIHLWDFGGQAILHSMHRCFLSEKACYVVTVRTRDTDNTPRARYWLRNVTAFAPHSPVVLYINCWEHSDGKRSVDETGLCKEFPNIKAVVYVSAKEADDADFRENLLETILRTATESAFFRQKINRKWVAVRDAVIRKSAKQNYLTKENYYALCQDYAIPQEQAPDLLTHFNILGVCFSYHQNILRQEFADYKLLNPVWLTNAVYSVIEEGTAQAQEGRIKLSSIQQMLVNQAPEQVVFIDKNGNRDVRPYKRTMPHIKYKAKECQYIIDVAEAYRLCYRVDNETLFFPALCTNNTPKEALDAPEDYPQHIEYVLTYDYLPDSVVHQLMVHCLQSDIALNHCWLRGVVLGSMDAHKAIVRMEDDENLRIEIWSKPEHPAYELFALLRREILIINERLNLHAVEWIVDGKDRHTLLSLLSAAKDIDIVFGSSTGKKCRASDLLGLFYEDWTLHFIQVHDGKITIPILPREFHRQSKDDQAFRRALYEAYNRICPYCGRVIDSIRDMQVDHILPQAYKDEPALQEYLRYLKERGFDIEKPDYVENYMPTHGHCNRDKSDHVELFALLARHERAQAKAKQVLKLYDHYKSDN